MPSIPNLKTQIQEAVPGILQTFQAPVLETFATGVDILDSNTGGIPKGALTQLCAAPWSSSGRTSLLHSLLARATEERQFCALVDATDSFDCSSAAARGVVLSRLFWVRCSAQHGIQQLEQAFKAADILLQNGGFPFVILDLGSVGERAVRKVPLTTWFRFSRVVEKSRTALICLLSHPVAHSCAALTIRFHKGRMNTCGTTTPAHAGFPAGLQCEIEVLRTPGKKPMQSVRPRLSFVVAG
jgi:hypothetical protein